MMCPKHIFKKSRWILFVTVVALLIGSSSCQSTSPSIPKKERPSRAEAFSVGPKNGTLFLMGGGFEDEDDSRVDVLINRFIELAGGQNAKIVVIPTALGSSFVDEAGEKLTDFLKKRGVKNVTLLHTVDPKIADTDAFVAPLSSAGGVWFYGGRGPILAKTYGGTKTVEMCRSLLDRGGVVGGVSAGAMIQGSFLRRNPHNDIIGDPQEGFGFITNFVVVPHVLAFNRHFEMFKVLKLKPELLGVGIDDYTAIIVKGNQFEVIGSRYVLIYDNSFWSRHGDKLGMSQANLFYFLMDGDKYDLKKRQVIK